MEESPRSKSHSGSVQVQVQASLSKSNHGRRRGGAFCFGDAEGQMIGGVDSKLKSKWPFMDHFDADAKAPPSYSPYSTHDTHDNLQHPQHPISPTAPYFSFSFQTVSFYSTEIVHAVILSGCVVGN